MMHAMAESEGKRIGKGSAAELLANWRAAERDRAAALDTATTASLAVEAATRAAHAARETAAAARLSLEAAQRAAMAARETADAADVLSAAAVRERAEADEAVTSAESAEIEAKGVFHDAQRKGFPRQDG